MADDSMAFAQWIGNSDEWQLQHRYMPQHTMTEVMGETVQDGAPSFPLTA